MSFVHFFFLSTLYLSSVAKHECPKIPGVLESCRWDLLVEFNPMVYDQKGVMSCTYVSSAQLIEAVIAMKPEICVKLHVQSVLDCLRLNSQPVTIGKVLAYINSRQTIYRGFCAWYGTNQSCTYARKYDGKIDQDCVKYEGDGLRKFTANTYYNSTLDFLANMTYVAPFLAGSCRRDQRAPFLQKYLQFRKY